MSRDTFDGYDEPLNIDTDPEEALKLLLQDEPAADVIEPVLDE